MIIGANTMGQAAVRHGTGSREAQRAPEPSPQGRRRHAGLPGEGWAGESTYLSRT